MKKSIKWWIVLLVLVSVMCVGFLAMVGYEKLLRGGPSGEIQLNTRKLDNLAAFLGIDIQDVDEAVAEKIGLGSDSISPELLDTNCKISGKASESNLCSTRPT